MVLTGSDVSYDTLHPQEYGTWDLAERIVSGIRAVALGLRSGQLSLW